MAKAPGQWVHERTLGGHGTGFWWRLDHAGSLAILVVHATKAGRKQQVVRALARDDLTGLLHFMDDGQWHPTAASTSLLKADPPPDGIATYLHHTLRRSTGDAVLLARAAVVLTHAGLWEWDGRQRSMRFRQIAAGLDALAAHYARRQAQPGPPPPAVGDVPRRGRHHATPGATPPPFSLATSFRGRAAELRGRLEAIDGGRHAPEKGRRREDALRAFLRRHLPDRYAVGHGEVTASWGDISHQVDILIYDAGAPPLLDDGGSLILAVETVYAAIEVKPLLNSTFLAAAVANIRSVKALRPPPVRLPDAPGGLWPAPSDNPPILGAVLSCHAIDAALLARRLHELQDGEPPCLWLDAVCALDQFVLHRQTGRPGPAGWCPDATDLPSLLVGIDAGLDSLLYFYLLLLQDLKSKTLKPPDLLSYARGAHFPAPEKL